MNSATTETFRAAENVGFKAGRLGRDGCDQWSMLTKRSWTNHPRRLASAGTSQRNRQDKHHKLRDTVNGVFRTAMNSHRGAFRDLVNPMPRYSALLD